MPTAVFCIKGSLARCGKGLAQAIAGGADRGHGDGPHEFRQSQKINADASRPRLVHHVAGNDHGQTHLAQLGRKQQPALQNARIHNVDDRLHRAAKQHIAGHHLFL